MPMPARALHRTPAAIAALAAALLCAACGKPEPPDTERPPEPQAGPAPQAGAAATQRAAVDAQTAYRAGPQKQ